MDSSVYFSNSATAFTKPSVVSLAEGLGIQWLAKVPALVCY